MGRHTSQKSVCQIGQDEQVHVNLPCRSHSNLRMLSFGIFSKISLFAAIAFMAPTATHAAVLWTTDFSGSNETARSLVNTNVDSLFTDVLTGTSANLVFSDTSFTGDPFRNVLSRGAFSPNTNVDNLAPAAPQNGGSWQSEFRYSGGTQEISLESIQFNIVRTNSLDVLQSADATVRDVFLTAEYSLDQGGTWFTIDSPKLVNSTASHPGNVNIATLYTFASPLALDHEEEDLWLRFTAENANTTAGAYISINDMNFNGVVVPEPAAVATLMGGMAVLLGSRHRRK